MIIFIGKITHPTIESANRALENAVEGDIKSAAEPGCIHHGHAQDGVDKRVIWLIHVYETIADVRAHMDADYYPPLRDAVNAGAIDFEAHQYVGMEAFNMLAKPSPYPVTLSAEPPNGNSAS